MARVIGAHYNVAGETWSAYLDLDTGRVLVARGQQTVCAGDAVQVNPLVVKWDPAPGVAEALAELDKAIAAYVPEPDPAPPSPPPPFEPAPTPAPIPGDPPIS